MTRLCLSSKCWWSTIEWAPSWICSAQSSSNLSGPSGQDLILACCLKRGRVLADQAHSSSSHRMIGTLSRRSRGVNLICTWNSSLRSKDTTNRTGTVCWLGYLVYLRSIRSSWRKCMWCWWRTHLSCEMWKVWRTALTLRVVSSTEKPRVRQCHRLHWKTKTT